VTGTQAPGPFRLVYVPGVTPDKWVRTWGERVPGVPLELVPVSVAEAARTLRDGAAEAALVRLPIDRTGLSAIPLYAETTVIVVPKDHEIAAVDEVAVEDVADYVVLRPLDECLEWDHPPGRPASERPATTQDAVDLVAAGVGLLVLPQSLARLHHRKDLTYRPMPQAPQSRVALSWPQEQTTDLMEEFIGIVRGRTVNSSRGKGAGSDAQPKPARGGAKAKAGSGAKPGSGEARRKPASGKSGSAAQRGKPRRRS
jgi:DNA-binding transcriptional LysR family regulator